jgi:hypothetical protein
MYTQSKAIVVPVNYMYTRLPIRKEWSPPLTKFYTFIKAICFLKENFICETYK